MSIDHRVTQIENVKRIEVGQTVAEPCSISIKDQQFSQIRSRSEVDDGAEIINTQPIDGGSKLLLPAIVDLSVTSGEPGFERKETLESLGNAAVSGGVGTALISPNTSPVIDTAPKVDFLTRRARDMSKANILCAGSIRVDFADDKMAEIGLMADAGAVCFSDGGIPFESNLHLLQSMEYCAGLGVTIMLRPQDRSLTSNGVMHESIKALNDGLPMIPVEAETVALMRDLELARKTKVSLIVDQISSSRSLALCEQAKNDGINIFVTVSAHHLYLNELDVGEYRSYAKILPPLRSERDRQALLAGVKSGVIDAIVSGHMPQPAEDKRLPFDSSSFGASGIETIILILNSLDKSGELEFKDSLAKVTENPAKKLNLNRGQIKIGAEADFFLFDPEKPMMLDASSDMISRSKNSPLDKRRLFGQVRECWVAGSRIYAIDT